VAVAILIYFTKVREDQTVVEYTFGYPETDRVLTIEKDTQQAQPSDGNADNTFAAVAYKILKTHKSDNDWPENGCYAA
jgi:hypothetical protein